jgi:hypothetical protein
VKRAGYVDSSEIHDSQGSEEEQEDWSDEEFVDVKKRRRSESSEEDDDDEGVDEDSQVSSNLWMNARRRAEG